MGADEDMEREMDIFIYIFSRCDAPNEDVNVNEVFGTITSGAYRLFRSQRSADTSNLHAAVECCCHRLVLANHSRSTCLPEMRGEKH